MCLSLEWLNKHVTVINHHRPLLCSYEAMYAVSAVRVDRRLRYFLAAAQGQHFFLSFFFAEEETRDEEFI